jgi:hypothetical protein
MKKIAIVILFFYFLLDFSSFPLCIIPQLFRFGETGFDMLNINIVQVHVINNIKVKIGNNFPD